MVSVVSVVSVVGDTRRLYSVTTPGRGPFSTPTTGSGEVTLPLIRYTLF